MEEAFDTQRTLLFLLHHGTLHSPRPRVGASPLCLWAPHRRFIIIAPIIQGWEVALILTLTLTRPEL